MKFTYWTQLAYKTHVMANDVAWAVGRLLKSLPRLAMISIAALYANELSGKAVSLLDTSSTYKTRFPVLGFYGHDTGSFQVP